jgi:hypothetical protein
MLRSLASEYDSFMTWVKNPEIIGYAPRIALFVMKNDRTGGAL